MAKTTQKKQVFSISQKYLEVTDILDNIENKSEFICQAILEKANGINKVDDDDVVLEDKIKKVLKGMMSENLFLVSGNPNNISSVVPLQKEVVQVPDNKEEVVSETEEDDSEYLKDIFKNM